MTTIIANLLIDGEVVECKEAEIKIPCLKDKESIDKYYVFTGCRCSYEHPRSHSHFTFCNSMGDILFCFWYGNVNEFYCPNVIFFCFENLQADLI